ncbi:MAG: PQQ-binding-like beta-propeller repeat protein [Deltaproteobacteria bacterium]|nr:PQQ-binding-like beta-propeller repeat protein [Deltaproteobacteria bacterium]
MRRSPLAAACACFAFTLACEPSPENRAGPHQPVSLPDTPITGMHYARTLWATVHRDSSNSDYVPVKPGAAVEVAWTALDGVTLLVGPIFGPEGNLYVPSGRGRGTSHLHAFDRDGKLLWEAPPMASKADLDYAAVVCAPIVDSEGHVYAADSNQLWSFTATGEQRWVADLPRHGVDGYFITPVFSKEGFVGGVSTDGKVALFRRESGELAVPVLDLPGVRGPASEDPPPGLWQGGLMAEEHVRPLWDLTFGREIEVANTPAVHPRTGRIFITAGGSSESEGVLYGIDTSRRGLRIAFTAPMGAGSGTSPAISPDGELVYAIDDAGLMVAIDAYTGARAWEAPDTMGQASPSVGPDGTIYSFNGIEGTIVAIDGATGSVRWRRQYDALAEEHLAWRPLVRRVTTVDGLITVTDSGLWTFFDLNYEISGGEQPYPQPRKVIVGQLDAASGELLAWFESRDSSGAFAVPDVDGSFYLTLSGAATSISYYGVDPKLPWFLRAGWKPQAGLVALRPVQPASP